MNAREKVFAIKIDDVSFSRDRVAVHQLIWLSYRILFAKELARRVLTPAGDHLLAIAVHPGGTFQFPVLAPESLMDSSHFQLSRQAKKPDSPKRTASSGMPSTPSAVWPSCRPTKAPSRRSGPQRRERSQKIPPNTRVRICDSRTIRWARNRIRPRMKRSQPICGSSASESSRRRLVKRCRTRRGLGLTLGVFEHCFLGCIPIATREIAQE